MLKATIALKLVPVPQQYPLLLETMHRFNAACNAIAEVAFQEHTANKIRLQHLLYHDIRHRFGLSAQFTVRAISKVCEAYKRDKTTKPVFRPDGAVIYDQRLMGFKGLDHVSLLTLAGRQLISCIFGPYQAAFRARIRGQADLVLRDGIFYLLVTAEVPDGTPITTTDVLGVDLGIVNLATDSTGTTYSGAHVRNLRRRHARLRKKLQAKGTTSAKRLLKKRRRKEQRFARDVNHGISKRLVAKAKDTRCAMALEDLTGIRTRITVRKAQRRDQHSWAFRQLRAFVEYKARLTGIPVMLVDPHYTSRTCPNPACRHCEKANRPTRDWFCCVKCGFAGPADHIAAVNIRWAALSTGRTWMLPQEQAISSRLEAWRS